MSLPQKKTTMFVDAAVTSKGQVTLPKELRSRLGLQKGSRVRFTMPASGAVEVAPVRYRLADIWEMADGGIRTEGVLSFEAMNAAKMRRNS